jgi:hypothetical protein
MNKEIKIVLDRSLHISRVLTNALFLPEFGIV